MPFACLYEEQFDHFNALMFESLVPIALLAAATGTEAALHIATEVRKRRQQPATAQMNKRPVARRAEAIRNISRPEVQAKVHRHTFAYFMTVLFLVLPG